MVVCIVGNPPFVSINGGGIITYIFGPAGVVPSVLTKSTMAVKSLKNWQSSREVLFGPPQSTFQFEVQPLRAPGESHVLWASFVPSMIVTISHLFAVSVLNCGRCQKGDEEFFSNIEPHAPMFVTAYVPSPVTSYWNRNHTSARMKQLAIERRGDTEGGTFTGKAVAPHQDPRVE